MLNDLILRNFSHELAFPLSVIFNKCLLECHFLDSWKLANVIPILRGKTDYRPISLLLCISKIFECILITKFFLLSIRSSLNPCQFYLVFFLLVTFIDPKDIFSFSRLHSWSFPESNPYFLSQKVTASDIFSLLMSFLLE